MCHTPAASTLNIADAAAIRSTVAKHDISCSQWMTIEAMGFDTAAKLPSRHSSFLRCILHVGFSATEKQMCGITARRIITMMAYIKAIWNWAISQFPSKTVCSCSPLVLFSLIAGGHLAISPWKAIGCPRPANRRTTRAVYFRPEKLCEWFTGIASYHGSNNIAYSHS